MKKSFGIIGSPIKHSLSPVLHKYWFDKYNLKADYSIIEAKDNDLSQIISRIRDGSLSGINVTLPFKQKIINHVDKIINDAELTGSVNTILLDGNESESRDIDVGVRIDSPTPINILGTAIETKPFAAPVSAVNTLHNTTPKAISFGLFTMSARTPMKRPAIE